MTDRMTDDTRVILLLCGVLDKDSPAKPLQLGEYNEMVRWLVSQKKRPESLLENETKAQAIEALGFDARRLNNLLDRGIQLGFALEEWHRQGLWVISRSDGIYPQRLKRHLREKAPPLLFGAGNPSLLSGGGLAIIGSRNVDTQGKEFTQQVAEQCAANNLPVISGGARGVDQISMEGALNSGGTVIGILADSLLKKSLTRNARHAMNEGKLLLLSPYHPSAGFTVGTAMGRNKLIYAMADYALVISADHKKGGTWAGAEEELSREKPIPVFVRSGENVPQGNEKLLELGAFKWPAIDKDQEIRTKLELSIASTPKTPRFEELTLFDPTGEDPNKDQ